MKTVVIDAGHGGTDPGGKSLGAPEKTLALRYAMRLGKYLAMSGYRVIYTRTTDVAVPLSQRAKVANDAGADLFVSVHLNASGNPNASGPWTIYAAPSARGKRIAGRLQEALAEVLGGSAQAAYPDESPWVGNRRLAVLRQTRMPAVLLELGFMTHAGDFAALEETATEIRLAAAVASAIREALGDAPAPPPPPPPEPRAPELAPFPAPPHPGEDDALVLEPIRVPTREHVLRAAERAGVSESVLCQAAPVVALVLRGLVAGNEGVRQMVAAELLGAFGGFRDRECP